MSTAVEAQKPTTTEMAKYATLMVWAALAIFALAKSVIVILTDVGAANLIDGRNPISFCNVLFAGNLVAAATLYLLHRKDWTGENFRKLTLSDWFGIFVMGILAGFVAPALGFLALENTTVTNVVFLGRIEPIVFMVLAAVLLSDRPDFWSVTGAAVSFTGVILIIYMLTRDMGGFMLGKGEIYALLCAATLAIGTLLSKLWLKTVPFGIFSVLRMVFGAVVYFIWAYYHYGPVHFVDIFAPVVWQWMLLYGALIVAGGQTLFLLGIRHARGQDVALAQSFSPIAAVVFAFLLLGEVPDTPILIGGGIIMLGIFLAQAGNWYQKRRERLSTSDVMEVEGRETFRGV